MLTTAVRAPLLLLPPSRGTWPALANGPTSSAGVTSQRGGHWEFRELSLSSATDPLDVAAVQGAGISVTVGLQVATWSRAPMWKSGGVTRN